MANEIDALLARIDDATLRQDLKTQFDRLRQKRQFGLVFEEHLPERVALPHHPIRRGTKVVLRDESEAEPRVVTKVSAKKATLPTQDGKTESVPIDSLIAIAEFGEAIYPGLKRLGSVSRGGDKPSHVVIKGENHHALEALRFTHAGKIDCIYIDPPYNTGARDWKYNNDYVDGDDAYRHSKWLAFMQRRLLLAKELLNPDDSVLIVTIDEKEVLRLGMLLEQTFPGLDTQLVTIVTNHAGSIRQGRFTRVEEYAIAVFLGEAEVSLWDRSMLGGEPPSEADTPTVWFAAIRTGGRTALRENRSSPVLFYPIILDAETFEFLRVGEPVPRGTDRLATTEPTGTVAVWPLSSTGREQTWQVSGERMTSLFHDGFARIRRRPDGSPAVTYLRSGTIASIESGRYKVTGRAADGSVEVDFGEGGRYRHAPTAVWYQKSHFARDYGTHLNASLTPGRHFPFPKSLYAVEDALRFFVSSKPNALVLDFFAGSGTTTHAVARLNRQDAGSRHSIVITNNEVSDDEAKRLDEVGSRPGDPAWEALGIFENITRPRIEAAITGVTPEGQPVKGDYKFTDEFPMSDGFEENVEFLELTYLDAEDIELDMAFAGIAPLLWMRAGSKGPMIEERVTGDGESLPFAITDTYAILFDPDQWRPFVEELPSESKTVFIVTDSASLFAGVASELPGGVDVVRLYENYLSTFAINQGGPR